MAKHIFRKVIVTGPNPARLSLPALALIAFGLVARCEAQQSGNFEGTLRLERLVELGHACRGLAVARDDSIIAAFGPDRYTVIAKDGTKRAHLPMPRVETGGIGATFDAAYNIKCLVRQSSGPGNGLHILSSPKYDFAEKILSDVLAVAGTGDAVAVIEPAGRIAIRSMLVAVPKQSFNIRDAIIRHAELSDDGKHMALLTGARSKSDLLVEREAPSRVWYLNVDAQKMHLAVEEKEAGSIDDLEEFVWEHLALDAKGAILVAAGWLRSPRGVESCVKVVETAKPREGRLFLLGTREITGIAVSGDGKYAATASRNPKKDEAAFNQGDPMSIAREEKICVYRIEDWDILGESQSLPSNVNDVAMTYLGRTTYIGCENGIIHTFAVP